MLRKISLVSLLTIAIFSSNSMANAAQISIENKVSLQASMLQHIDGMTIDGYIPRVRLSDGSITNLVATKSHPMILAFGDKFVLCTDFRDPKGNFVNVDFYLTKHKQNFVVFQTEIDNRGPLKKLMKAGKVSTLD